MQDLEQWAPLAEQGADGTPVEEAETPECWPPRQDQEDPELAAEPAYGGIAVLP